MSPAISPITPPTDGEARPTCCCCMGALSEVALKCTGCQAHVHLRCSELPDYQLVRLALSQAQYMCCNCVKTKTVQTMDEYDTETTKIKEAIAKEVSIIDQLNSELEDNERAAGENAAATDDADRTDAAHTNPNTDTSKKTPCRYFMRRGCRHGRKGTSCAFDHPKLCFKYIKNGDRRGGCKLGNKCSFAHPKLCDSYKSGICKRERCNFYHTQGTKFGTNHGNENQLPQRVPETTSRPESSRPAPTQPQ